MEPFLVSFWTKQIWFSTHSRAHFLFKMFVSANLKHYILNLTNLFVWSFSSHSRVFTHMETSQLPVKGCKIWPCSALMGIEQWGFLSVPHLLWHGASVYNGPKTRDTHTYCRAFSNEAVTICFYDLGLSWLRFEHPTFNLRGERSYPLRHRRDWPILELIFYQLKVWNRV